MPGSRWQLVRLVAQAFGEEQQRKREEPQQKGDEDDDDYVNEK